MIGGYVSIESDMMSEQMTSVAKMSRMRVEICLCDDRFMEAQYNGLAVERYDKGRKAYFVCSRNGHRRRREERVVRREYVSRGKMEPPFGKR
jgi:hypothetical protein